MDVDRSKTAWRGDQKATKKGRSGGLLNNLLLQKAGSAAAGAPKTSE